MGTTGGTLSAFVLGQAESAAKRAIASGKNYEVSEERFNKALLLDLGLNIASFSEEQRREFRCVWLRVLRAARRRDRASTPRSAWRRIKALRLGAAQAQERLGVQPRGEWACRNEIHAVVFGHGRPALQGAALDKAITACHASMALGFIAKDIQAAAEWRAAARDGVHGAREWVETCLVRAEEALARLQQSA